MNLYYVWALFVLSTLMLLSMFARSGLRDPLVVIVIFYQYFSYGPVINILLGNEVYFGIVQERVSDAATIFTLGTAGLFFGSFLPLTMPERENVNILISRNNLFSLNIFLLTGIFFTAYILIITGIDSLLSAGKLEKVSLVTADIHYTYMLLQFYLVSFYFLSKSRKLMHYLYLANLSMYIVYCIVLDERDFIFLLVSILFFTQALGSGNKKFWRYGLLAVGGLGLAIVATIAFNVRTGNTENFFQSLLNQGSTLFINTQIVNYVDMVGYFYGETYVNSVLSIFPEFLYQSDFSLPTWFISYYAPGGASGYGFALDAEAYMNFGYLGVIVFFFLIATASRVLYNSLQYSSFSLYLNVFFTGFLMYAIRNDSFGLFNAIANAVVFFAIVMFTSLPALKGTKIHEPIYNH